jgi:Rab3 GTPase-activating protein regulatory subunit N-terminus
MLDRVSHNDDPIEICMLLPDHDSHNYCSNNSNHHHHHPHPQHWEDDEQITSLTVVVAADAVHSSRHAVGDSKEPELPFSLSVSPTRSSSGITGTSTLMTGVLLTTTESSSTATTTTTTANNITAEDSDARDGNNELYGTTVTTSPKSTTTFVTPPPQLQQQQRLAIVFGTTHGRVYTVEVDIIHHTNNNDSDNITSSPSNSNSTAANRNRTTYGGGCTLQRIQCPTTGTSLYQIFSNADDITGGDVPSSHHHHPHQRSKSNSTATITTLSSSSSSSSMPPVRGIQSIYTTDDDGSGHWNSMTNRNNEIIWIIYNDATFLRMQAMCCFPSLIWHPAASTNVSIEDYVLLLQQQQQQQPYHTGNNNYNSTRSLQTDIVVRCRIRIPQGGLAPCGGVRIVPFLPHHQSSIVQQENIEPQSHMNQDRLYPYPRIGNGGASTSTNHVYEAMVFSSLDVDGLLPTFSFYQSEGSNHMVTVSTPEQQHPGGPTSSPDDDDDDDDGILFVSVTKALVGTAIGAFRWGLGGAGNKNHIPTSERHHGMVHRQNQTTNPKILDSSKMVVPFPSLQRPPVELYLHTTFHDAPRKIEFCSIDPERKLAATADALGRILLIDLGTKQIIRMWKGFRDASCYWIQQKECNPQESSGMVLSATKNALTQDCSHHPTSNQHPKRKKPSLFLVIHSRQRRIVEIWRVRHGGRVASFSVGRDARIIPFTIAATLHSENGVIHTNLAQCYLIQSTIPGSNLNQLELIRVNYPEPPLPTEAVIAIPVNHNSPPRHNSRTGSSSKVPSSMSTSRTGALRLKHLQQLLSASSIHSTIDDVRTALHDITSLVDLSTALDLLATGSALDDKLSVQGSNFHRDAISHCRNVLNAALSGGRTTAIDPSLRTNPHVQGLSHKIEYHEQVGLSLCSFAFDICSPSFAHRVRVYSFNISL